MDFNAVEIESWQISLAPSDPRRLRRLEAPDSPAQLADHIAKTAMQRSSCLVFIEYGYVNSLLNAKRIRVIINLSYELLDLFWNSRAGYRAQYSISADNGDNYNRLISGLIELSLHEDLSLLTGQFQSASLSTRHSKISIWPETEHDSYCAGYIDPLKKRRYWLFDTNSHLLDVKGAFIDANGRILVSEKKTNRSQELYMYGHS